MQSKTYEHAKEGKEQRPSTYVIEQVLSQQQTQ
jgi:hypothetical protein